MKDLFTRARSLALACLGVAALAVALTSCGGGGSKDDLSGGSKGNNGGPAALVAVPVSSTLIGVAAVGAPLLGAQITVIDAAGVVQGSAVTDMAEGRYSLTLNSGTQFLPLMLRAKGVDMAGRPVLLHSLAQSLNPPTASNSIINITPLTNAVVGLMLNADPAATFQTSLVASSTSTKVLLPAALANATTYTSANTLVKTLIGRNLTAASITNATSLDLFKDAMLANKTGLDNAIEGLSIQFGQSGSLYLSNKLTSPSLMPEVTVDLATWSITPAASSKTSALTTLMPNVALIDKVALALNAAMNPNVQNTDLVIVPAATGILSGSGSSATRSSKVIFSSGLTQDGYDYLQTASQLVSYASAGKQLSQFQILGCLDTTIVAGQCSKIKVAALVYGSAATANSAGVFEMTMNYDSTTTNATGWSFVGNGVLIPWNVYPSTWAEFDSTGGLTSPSQMRLLSNPTKGAQVVVQAADVMSTATLRLIGDGGGVHTAAFVYCNLPTGEAMCQGTQGVRSQGDLFNDQMIEKTSGSFLGDSTLRQGSTFTASFLALGVNNLTDSLALTADLPSSTASTLYPKPDTLPLYVSDITAGLTVSWNNWAALNPNKRVVEVRVSVTSPTTPVINKVIIPPISANQATLPAITSVPPDAMQYILWMIAQDDQGRRYISKIIAQ
ncbi:MAG: hypothetical protein QM749_17280 [Aquabacterium sp.]